MNLRHATDPLPPLPLRGEGEGGGAVGGTQKAFHLPSAVVLTEEQARP